MLEQPFYGVLNSEIKLTPTEKTVETIRAKNPQQNNTTVAQIPNVDDTFKAAMKSLKDNRLTFTEEKNDLSAAYQETWDGVYKPKYDKYYEGLDNADMAAQNQGTLGRILNGITKNTLKAGSYVLDGTIGTVYGISKGMQEGSLEAVWNNDFSKLVDQFGKNLDVEMANHISAEERNRAWYKNLGTANFWANDVLGGVAFMAGAIGSEAIWAAATGGSSLALSTAKWSLRTGGIAAKAVGQGERYASFAKKALTSYNRSVNYGKVASVANNARFLITSAGFESGVEARHSLNENLEGFVENTEKRLGRTPTQEEYSAFMKDAIDQSNTVFATNMAIVGSSNILQFGRIFGLDYGITKSVVKPIAAGLNKKLFGIGMKFTDGVATALTPSKIQKITGKAFHILKPMVVEGLYEEGLQGVVSKISQKQLAAKYDPSATKENLDYVNAFKESFKEQYNPAREEFKEIAIGMLIGKLGGHFTGKGFSANTSSYSKFKEERDALPTNAKAINESRNKLSIAQKTQMDRFMTMNQELNTTQNANTNAQKGNFSVATMETNAAQFAHLQNLNRVDLIESGVLDMQTMIDNANDDSIIAEYGVNAEQVQEIKANLKAQLSENQSKFEKANKIAEDLAPSMQGYKNIPLAKQAHFKEELSRNIFLGVKAGETIDGLASTIEEITGRDGVADMISFYSQMDNQSKKTAKRLSQVKRTKEDLQNQYVELQQNHSTLLEEAKRKEENTAIAEKIAKNRTAAVKVMDRMTELERENKELSEALKNMPNIPTFGLGNEFTKVEKTPEQIVEIENTLDSLEKYAQELAKTDINKANSIKHLVQEIKNSKQLFDEFHKTYQQLSDPKFNVNQYKGIAKGIAKGRRARYETPKENAKLTKQQQDVEAIILDNNLDEYSAFQFRLLNDLLEGAKEDYTLENYQDNIDDATWKEFLDDDIVDETVLEGITDNIFENIPLTNREKRIAEAREEEVDKILKYLKQQKGDSLKKLKAKITPQNQVSEIEQIRNLIKQVRDSLNDRKDLSENISEQNIPTEDDFQALQDLESKSINNELTPKEEEAYKELKTKINEWGKVEGISEQGFDLESLYKQLFSLEATQIEEGDGIKDLTDIVTEEDIIQGQELETSLNRWWYNILQTYDRAFFKPTIDGKGVSLHQMDLEGILPHLIKSIPGIKKIYVGNQGLRTVDVMSLIEQGKFNKKSVKIVYEVGGKEKVIVLETEKIKDKKGEIKEGKGIFVNFEHLQNINDDSNLQISGINSKSKIPTQYSPIYLKIGNKLNPLQSSFIDENTVSDIEEIQEIEEGEELSVEVNPNHPYNIELLKLYKQGKISLEEVEANFVVDIRKNDSFVGHLKADNNDNNAQSEEHLNKIKELRQNAISTLLENEDVKFPIATSLKVKVKKVYLGHPITETELKDDKTVEQTQYQFTDEKLENVETTGFIENGEIQLKSDRKNVISTFISALKNKSKKNGVRIPIVIINVRGKMVAYPISLISEVKSYTEVFDSVMNDESISETERIIKLNQILAAAKISPVNTITLEGRKDGIRKALEEVKIYPNVAEFTSKEKTVKEILQGKATININTAGQMFHSPKVVMDFGVVGEQIKEEDVQQGYDEESGEVYETNVSPINEVNNSETVATTEEMVSENVTKTDERLSESDLRSGVPITVNGRKVKSYEVNDNIGGRLGTIDVEFESNVPLNSFTTEEEIRSRQATYNVMKNGAVVDSQGNPIRIQNDVSQTDSQTDNITVDDTTKTIEEFNKEEEFYRVVVGTEAFTDIIESGVVRTNANNKPLVKGSSVIDLSNRPTAFPSFSKGQASIRYAQANPNNYIIVSTDQSIQPSTSGRHGKGTTFFPTDSNGKHLSELNGENISVYQHVGEGKYELVYKNGKEIKLITPNQPQTKVTDNNTMDNSKIVNEENTTTIDEKKEIERISNITDLEKRKVAEIKFIMSNLFAGVGEAGANKIKEYANRIINGQSRDKVIEGLPPSFVKGIDALLAVESISPNQTQEKIDTTIPENDVEKDEFTDVQIEEMIQSGEITFTDDEGNPCAKKGMKSDKFTKGGKWELITTIKGKNHNQGGVDLTINSNGSISFKNKLNNDIKAKYGLVILSTKIKYAK